MDFYIKRNDTLPIIEYKCLNDAGNPVDVHDTTIKFNMGWKFALPSEISSITQQTFYWPDYIPFFLIGDVMNIDQERIRITDIDRVANSITVDRGIDATEPAKHPVCSIVSVIRIESVGALKTDGTDGIIKYEWMASSRDTKMAGRFEAEFEVTFLTSGKRQTFPMAQQTPIRIFIKDDINVR